MVAKGTLYRAERVGRSDWIKTCRLPIHLVRKTRSGNQWMAYAVSFPRLESGASHLSQLPKYDWSEAWASATQASRMRRHGCDPGIYIHRELLAGG